MAGGSVEGELDAGTVALDVPITRVTEALMQQSHDFILHGKVQNGTRKKLLCQSV